jgi:hypothetical protein
MRFEAVFLIIATLALVGPAQAVVNESPLPPVLPPVTEDLPGQTLRLDLPVAWQLTRTRLLGPGATTLTESFRETWTLEVRPGGLMNLRSPRATVPVYTALAPVLKLRAGEAPRALLISEHDFARLVGVGPAGAATDEADDAAPGPVQSPLTIQLGKTAKGGTDINLNWSEEEHYAVHLDIGTTSVVF